jgi:hypothetical protein
MAFDFVENFTIEMPKFTDSNYNFMESFDSKQGLIIEVAAIHERIDSKLQ